MDKDTPRYGSRDEDDNPRQTDESNVRDEWAERRRFTPSRYSDDDTGTGSSRYSDDDTGAGSSRKPAGSYASTSDEPTSSYRSRLSSLESLRASRYDADETPATERDSYPPPRDNGEFLAERGFEADRSRYRSRLASSHEDPERTPRNPLLRTDPSERKFSWEQETPVARTRPILDRDTDSGKYASGRSRFDELTARRAKRSPKPGYDPDDAGYGDDAAFEAEAAPVFRDRPIEPDLGFQSAPPLSEGYHRVDQEPAYDPYEAPSFQGAHARELADVDERYIREYQYDADGSQPRQEYGDFDQDFPQFDQPYDEQPEKRRRGPFLLLGSLVGVAVIAGGLIFAYQGLREGGSETVPVVNVDPEPTKVVPPEPGGVDISRKKKLIYDRIIGEDTQSNDTIVPREEEPLSPSNQSQTNTVPEADSTAAAVTPPSATEQDSPDLNGSEPLPLPLPPPPSGIQELVEATQAEDNSSTATLGTGGQIVSPTGLEGTVEPPAPASQETLVVAEAVQPPEPTAPVAQTQQPEAVTQLITSPPLPKAKPTPPSLQAEPGVAVPTGPIQIAPLPGSVARETVTTDQSAPDQTSPIGLQPTAETPTQQSQRRVASSRFEEELSSGVSSSFTQQNTQVTAVDTQARTLAPAPAVPTPTPAVPQEQITGGRYLVQLGAFRSQEEAESEFQSLRDRHPGLLGDYKSLVQQADLGATGVYFRLRIGPIETKSNASQLCNSLIAAGERDCLVRQR